MRWTALGIALAACSVPAHHAGDAGVDAPVVADAPAIDAPPPNVTITSTVDSTRFVTREHMLASGEMQISGEPFAEAMGRDLTGYSRNLVPPDVYIDGPHGVYGVDLAGFSTAVESYEYSKQPMNMIAFESGAGTDLAANALGGSLATQIEHFAEGANSLGRWVFHAGTWPSNNAIGDVNPTGAGSGADNPLGWPGMLPTAHVFASFDPAIDPTSAENLQCSIASDDNPNEQGGALVSGDYECSYLSLHLRDRATQIEPAVTPGADGFSTWKYALWTINYMQIMHDGTNQAVDSVADADLDQVGKPGNTVGGAGGTWLGSSDIEGFQAAMFVLMMNARADDWLLRLATTNGTALSGFASLQAALAYDYAAPLRWFPGKLAVTEAPLAYSISAANPELFDSLGILLGYATAYALGDPDNRDVGGSQTVLAYFDDDPFDADDGMADGEPTLHDRALGMIRVALIDLDRRQTSHGVFVDTVGGHTISAPAAAYSVIALRVVQRATSSQLELYSNNLPDTAVGRTPLDALPINYPGAPSLTFSQRVDQLVHAHADLLMKLTTADGHAYAGWDLDANAPTTTDDTLDAHTAAIRGLFAAYLATGDTRYRDRAEAVYARMDKVFYDGDARVWGSSPAPVTDVTYTPLRFALLQSALRDVYELVASRPGYEQMEPVLEARVARLNKLVLNGWDDRNYNKHVDWPDECTNVSNGMPHGGLQMGERTLTGETGRYIDEIGGNMGPPTSDRESDCVPEVDDAHLPAALAASVTFHVVRQ